MTDAADLDRHRHLYGLLRAALDVDEGERATWLVQQCADDAGALAQLRDLLGGSQPSLLDTDAASMAARLNEIDGHVDPLPHGTRIGNWVIERPLGHGGMGMVYLATRQGDGFLQRGALKLIKRGMDSAAVLERLRRERRILASLNHPNIAHLLDGGITEAGQPFLVMEYVDGSPLADWAQRTQASLAARVTLFLQLCEAVAHAHRQLVVHSDIKPGNVLVDAEGHPHLLDFGIAKLLDDESAAEQTVLHARFLSRAYAAPEQIDGGAISTATDVYQLGVLLFELLTGTRHSDAPTASQASRQLVRAHGNTPMSAPIPLRQLRGDISVIVARATDAEPARRYASVDALAEDLRRWHHGQPILARPDSLGYRARLFVRRHTLAVGTGMVAALALLVAVSFALWQAAEARAQARRATAEAASARASQQFMLNVFTQAEPWRNAGHQPTALELAERALQRVDGELADQPYARADMYYALARLFTVAGDIKLAKTAATQAAATLQAQPDVDPERLFHARLRLAHVQFYTGDFDGAQATLDLLDASAAAGLPQLRSATLPLRANLARDRGRLRESQRLSLQVAHAVDPGQLRELREAWWHVAQAERALGRYPAALAAEQRSRTLAMADADSTAATLGHAALTAWALVAETDAPAQAARELSSLAARTRQMFGDSLYTAASLLIYAQAQRRIGHTQSALRLLREAERLALTGTGGGVLDAAPMRVELASTLIDLGQIDQALPLLAAADVEFARVGGEDDARRWFLRMVGARADPHSPAAALRRAWQQSPEEARERPQALLWLAQAELREGDAAQARLHWRETLAELDRQGRPLSALAWQAHAGLAGLGDPAEQALACSQARLLFGTDAAQVRTCADLVTAHPTAPQSTTARHDDLQRLDARITALLPLDATYAAWLQALDNEVGPATP